MSKYAILIKTFVQNIFLVCSLLLTNDGRCNCEIKSRTVMTKATYNKKTALFTSKMDLESRKKLVKCYIWSIALYGAETGTVWAVDREHLEIFKMWC
jgi:hypothetical protein